MNILLTNFHPGKGGGHTTYLNYLFNDISSLRSSINIYIAVPKTSKLNQDLKKNFQSKVFDIDFPGKPKNFLKIIKNVKAFSKLVKKNKINIVHTNGTPDHKIVMLCKWFYKLDYKIVRTKHDSFPIKQHWFAKKLYDKYTDELIVVSRYQYTKISDINLKNKTTIICNGVDLKYFKPRKKSKKLANKFQLLDSDLVFVSVAGTATYKGWQLLVEATSRLDKNLRDSIKIIIVGNSPAEYEIEKFVNTFKMQDNVIFTGFMSDVRNVISVADLCFVLSTNTETISFACREMMSMGRAVLVSDYAGLPENVTHQEDGWIVKSNSVREIVKFIRYLPEVDLEKLSQNAYKKAQNEFGSEKFIEKTLSIYYSL